SQRVPLAWLRSALEDAQDAVRAAAVTALAMRAEPGITGLLEAALEDTSDTVQQAACRALGARGGSASLAACRRERSSTFPYQALYQWMCGSQHRQG
ncbi:MAG: HEAT repeat domain-containing protein, partial [Ktedonobacteraceae bacterium]